MSSDFCLSAREKRPPLWALSAPALYLAAAIAAVVQVLRDHSDAGILGTLVAVGLAPAFVLPAVFSTRAVRLAITGDGITIEGRIEKVDDARVETGERGSALLHLTMRSGKTRSFIVASAKEAHRFAAFLPPVSAPAVHDALAI
jgi:hypothetical protein